MKKKRLLRIKLLFVMMAIVLIVFKLLNVTFNRTEIGSQKKEYNAGTTNTSILGDLNNDGSVNDADIQLMHQHISAKSNSGHPEWILSQELIKKADINNNNDLDSADALFFIRYKQAKSNSNIANKHPDWLHEVSGISVSQSSISTTKGKSIQLTASISPATAIDRTISWNSSNPTIVSVADGKITTIKPGTAIVYAKSSNGKQATCQVTVNPILPTRITLPATKTIAMGENYQLQPTIEPANADNKTVTYTISSNVNIAELKGNGIVHGTSHGTVTVTAKTQNGLSATCRITVSTSVKTEEMMGYIVAIGHRYSNVDKATPNPVSDGIKSSLSSTDKDGIPGEGDAVFVYSNGEYLLMDTFTGHGLNDIEYFIDRHMKNKTTGEVPSFNIYLSHRDSDHYANCAALVKKYNVPVVYMPNWGDTGGNLGNTAKTKWREVRTDIKNAAESVGKTVTFKYLSAGDTFKVGRFTGKVLYGPVPLVDSNGKDLNSPNNESLVTMIESPQGVKYLTAGDIESEVESRLVTLANSGAINLRADIYKANHHGRNSAGNPANTDAFVKKVSPSFYFYDYLFNHDLDFVIDSSGNTKKEWFYKDSCFGQQFAGRGVTQSAFMNSYANYYLKQNGNNKTEATLKNEAKAIWEEGKTLGAVERLSAISNGYSTAFNGQVVFNIYNTGEIVPRPERNFAFEEGDAEKKGIKKTVVNSNGESITVYYRFCNMNSNPTGISKNIYWTNSMINAIKKKPKN